MCLSDQESLVSFPRGSVNGAATPGAGSSSGGLISHLGNQVPIGSTDLGVAGGSVSGTGTIPSGQAGDRGSCSADSGVRGSSDRESGGATSVGGNLSDSTTDGKCNCNLSHLFTVVVNLDSFVVFKLELESVCTIV